MRGVPVEGFSNFEGFFVKFKGFFNVAEVIPSHSDVAKRGCDIRMRGVLVEGFAGFVEFDGNSYLKAFLERAYGSFYELVYGLVDCVEYGVPQYRCRFICMGTRRDLVECDGILGSLPRPQCFSDVDLETLERARRESLFDVSDEVDDLTVAPGIRYFPDRPVLIPPQPIAHTAILRGRRSKSFVEFYRRLRAEEPDRLVMDPVHQEEFA